MASLLPAIPTDWHNTRPSYGDRRVSTDVRDSGRRWGADKREYGGMGVTADHVIRRGGVASRSHRHYGSGIFNCSAQMQPYQITDFLLSDSRPCDQLLPPPLLTNKINHHRQLCEYPGNHTYTSHRSKFAVFPLADQSTSSKLSPLTRGTTDALQQIHHHQFCTTTYQQTYTNPWTSRVTELHSNPTSRAETSSGVTDEGDKNKEERFEEYCEVKSGEIDPKLCLEEDSSEQRSQDVSTGESHLDICEVVKAGERKNRDDGGSLDKEVAVKKRVHWQDKEGESEGEGESSRAESSKQAERGEEEEEVETERGSEGMEDTCDTETTGKELLDEEEKERQKESVATSLPQLPIHFQRVSSKYCRNQLSPIWPCSIPYYLTRPHSMLQSLIPRPTVKFTEKTTRPVERSTTAVEQLIEGKNSSGIVTGLVDDVIVGDVIGESPQQLPALLSGSGIPQSRLGVRFKARAHSRYHQLYPDRTPDLRDSQIESKKYFFFGVHSSVLR